MTARDHIQLVDGRRLDIRIRACEGTSVHLSSQHRSSLIAAPLSPAPVSCAGQGRPRAWSAIRHGVALGVRRFEARQGAGPWPLSCPTLRPCTTRSPGEVVGMHCVPSRGAVDSQFSTPPLCVVSLSLRAASTLSRHRGELFPDEMLEDLFTSGRGRPSIPADVVARSWCYRHPADRRHPPGAPAGPRSDERTGQSAKGLTASRDDRRHPTASWPLSDIRRAGSFRSRAEGGPATTRSGPSVGWRRGRRTHVS